MKKALSILLALTLCLSLLPLGVMADEQMEEAPAAEAVEEVEVVEPVSEPEPEPVAEPTLEQETEPEPMAELETEEAQETADEEPTAEDAPAEATEDSAEETPIEEPIETAEEAPALDGAVVASGTCGNNLSWSLADDGLLTIFGLGEMTSHPWTYDYSEVITEVFIVNGVTNVAAGAFRNCVSLTSITIPNSVTRIENLAFYFCTSLTSVTIPNSVNYIGNGAFNYTGLTSIAIPDSVTFIDSYAFSSNRYLESITISNSLTGIARGMLTGCSALKRVVIPSGVISIGEQAFDGCLFLNDVTIPDSVQSIGDTAFQNCIYLKNVYYTGNQNQWNQITIGSNNEYLSNATLCFVSAKNAFSSMAELENLASKSYSEWTQAFYSGSGSFMISSNIVIPEKLELFFDGELVISSGNTLTVNGSVYADSIMIDGTLQNNGSVYALSIVLCGYLSNNYHGYIDVHSISYSGGSFGSSGSMIIGSSVPLHNAAIGHTLVLLPGYSATCENEGRHDSYYCSVCGATFSDAYGKTKNNTIIPALGHNWSEWTVITPATYEAEGEETRTCSRCGKNETYVIPTLIPSGTCGDNATWSLTNDGNLTISGTGAIYDYSWGQKSGYSGYFTTAPWGAYRDSIKSVVIESGITYIGRYAFYWCNQLTSATIPEGITNIAYEAFAGCTSLTSISIPDGVITIGERVFLNCESMTQVSIPASVTSIGGSAFSGCTSLAYVYFRGTQAEWNSIAIGTDNDCLENATLWTDDASVIASGTCGDNLTWTLTEDGVLTIYGTGDMEWYESPSDPQWSDCRAAIQTVVIKDGVTSIGGFAFAGCSNLTSVTIPDSVTLIDDAAFQCCTSLTRVTIPDGVEDLCNSVFVGCTSLTGITLPDGMLSIGDGTFGGCSSLKDITIPDSVTYIYSCTFSGCISLTSITIPDSVTTIEAYAFEGCSGLKEIIFEGDAPLFYSWEDDLFFYGVTATAYYPSGNETWTEDVMQSYGGTITWVPYEKLIITAQPQDVTAEVGDTLTFTVEAEGNDLTYQWYYSYNNGKTFKPLTGKTSPSYSFKLSESNAGRQVYCEVKDVFGNVLNSDIATAYIVAELTITAQPTNQRANIKQRVEFTVEAAGGTGGLTYQWYYKSPTASKFAPVNGDAGKSETYSFKLSAANAGRMLYCVVTDKDGNSVTSDIVVAIAEDGPQIDVQPTDASVAIRKRAYFTVEASGGTGELMYQWYYKSATATKFSPVKGDLAQTASYNFKLSETNAGRQLYCVITDEAGISVVTNIVTANIKTD